MECKIRVGGRYRKILCVRYFFNPMCLQTRLITRLTLDLSEMPDLYIFVVAHIEALQAPESLSIISTFKHFLASPLSH